MVTEKVHGANLAVVVDDGCVRYAKRTGLLDPDDDFYGYREHIPPRYNDKFQALFQLAQTRFPTMHSLTIYGELFGGDYPHDEVVAVQDLLPVQTGISYCPGLEFYAFDVVWADGTGMYGRCIELDM